MLKAVKLIQHGYRYTPVGLEPVPSGKNGSTVIFKLCLVATIVCETKPVLSIQIYGILHHYCTVQNPKYLPL